MTAVKPAGSLWACTKCASLCYATQRPTRPCPWCTQTNWSPVDLHSKPHTAPISLHRCTGCNIVTGAPSLTTVHFRKCPRPGWELLQRGVDL
jgi:hypothetical protein